MHRITCLLLALLALCACGTKGSLYLPPPEAEQTPSAKQKGAK
jgi:predicted small lipoprotein YifL